MRFHALGAALFFAGLLTACGSGGDGNDPPVPVVTTVSLSGTAAKGLLANAEVNAYAVNTDGTVGSTPLNAAPAVTDASGAYALSFTGAAGVPYVIRVSAKTDGTTKHLDEVTGEQFLPAGFSMRSVIVPEGSGAVTATAAITPFSEMAVAAAVKASGGVTAANAASAVATMTQLLGFNPITAPAPSTAATATPEAQKLAVMLAAVSEMADSGSLGCAQATGGEKTQCVVEGLAAATSISTIKLETASADVSAVLNAAVSTVLATPSLVGDVPASSLNTVVANLACTTGCAAVNAAGSPIGVARTLFTELRSDWITLFSRGGIAQDSAGAVNLEGWKFREAMRGAHVPAEVMVKDLGAMLLAADLYNDYKAGRDTVPSRGRATGEFASDTPGATAGVSAIGCTLYQDDTYDTPANAISNARYVGCSARYYVNFDAGTGQRQEWRHAFRIVPGADGAFSYSARANLRTVTASTGAIVSNQNLQADVYAGSFTAGTNVAGNITSFAAEGQLPAAFKLDGNTLVNDHHDLAVTGTRTVDGFKVETASLQGTLMAYSDATTLVGTLAVKEGSTITSMPVTADGARPSDTDPARQGSPASGSLNIVWTRPGAEFEGLLSATEGAWDASNCCYSPTRLVLSGALRNIEGGVTTEFLSGALTLTFSGWSTFNDSLPVSATNRVTEAATFVGTATAPSRPKLEITLSAQKTSDQDEPSSVTLQYRSLGADGTPRMVIGATATRGSDGATTLVLTEASANLRMELREGDATTALTSGSTTLGVLDRSSGLLTFSDGSFVSVDAGL